MGDVALAAGYTLVLWWASTALILYLDGLPRATHRHTLRGATVLAGLALWGLVHTRHQLDAAGAYCAFTCALLVWAWQEVAFLLGVVTGPRRTPCPPGARGWVRLRAALQAVLYHELALVLLALAVWAASGDGGNQVGLWTYLALWGMRQSAKLNVYLGVRNLGEAFLPEHMAYLASYFRHARMNPLLPVSLALGTAATWACFQALADTAASDTHARAGLALLGTLLALGTLEHLLLVLPLPGEALWGPALKARRSRPVAG